MATQIQLRRGTAAEWTSANPTLAEGEIGLELDTSKFKIGNGSDNWTTLDYGFESLPVGGTTGQILAKDSASDYDYVWIDNATDSIKFIVDNDSGVNILKGDAVMSVGATALGRIEVALAVADGTVDAKFMLGVAVEDIDDGDTGEIAVFGPITGVDTSAYDVGDVLYIDPSNAGKFTDVQPAAPDLNLPIAIVTRDNPSVGEIFVRMYSQAHGLVELDDVNIAATPTDGDVLTYDSGTDKWVPEAPATATIPDELSDLTDVDTSAAADNYVLTYDNGTSTWVAEAPATIPDELSDLTDVDTSGALDGDVLTYDNGTSTWVVDSTVVKSTDIRTIVSLTQTEYDGLGVIDPETLYIIVEEES